MGILSRFKMVMNANVNSIMDQAKDPEKEINEYMQMLNRDLGAVKAETAAVLLNERRAKSQLDECNAEIKKLQRYAEKSLEAGKEDDALKFLEKKAKQVERLNDLNGAYELAAAVAESMKQMQDKLVSDIGKLEARYAELKGKLSFVKAQGGRTSGSGNIHSSLDALEEKANFAFDRAMALAELQSDDLEGDELDKKFAQLEKESASSVSVKVEDELAAMKDRLNNKE